jgi:serine/threonine protein phosphatase 1
MVLQSIFGKQQENTVISGDIPQIDPSHRLYAVGDIHGRDDLLNDMIEVIARDILTFDDGRAPKIIFLGDYIDRGDHSRQVLDTLTTIQSDLDQDSVYFLRGNHEAALLNFLQNPEKSAGWLRFGGLQTLVSYGVSPPLSTSEAHLLQQARHDLHQAMGDHIGFLQKTLPWFRSGDVVFVHAGLDPNIPLEAQTEDALLWGKSDFIHANGVQGLRVVHGHYDADAPVITPRRICLDTGAYYSGTLSAMRFDQTEHLLTSRDIKLNRTAPNPAP